MTIGDYVLRLELAGYHEEAARIAHAVVEMYKEDPTAAHRPDDGTCAGCGKIFTDNDCQHDTGYAIVCDRCYLNRGGK